MSTNFIGAYNQTWSAHSQTWEPMVFSTCWGICLSGCRTRYGTRSRCTHMYHGAHNQTGPAHSQMVGPQQAACASSGFRHPAPVGTCAYLAVGLGAGEGSGVHTSGSRMLLMAERRGEWHTGMRLEPTSSLSCPHHLHLAGLIMRSEYEPQSGWPGSTS